MQNKFLVSAIPAYLLVIGIFLLIISPNFLSEGMFMDGLVYSTISRNMSIGIGTFWNPSFTQTIFPVFHEHPPLAFGIQSIFYSIFGESRFIEKIYSFSTYVITAFIILRIWKLLGFKNGWIVLLIWGLTPIVFWACPNNMLENTLMIFTSLSVLFYLKSLSAKNRYLYILLSGFMLSFGFLTKGFVAFFPWVLPLLYWLFFREKAFYKVLAENIVLIASTIIPLLLLILFSVEAKQSIVKYMDAQVINSLQNRINVDSRFFILRRFFLDLIPGLVIAGLLYFLGRLKKGAKNIATPNYKLSLVFFILALTGVIPIMISMKQSLFYALPAFPFSAIAIAILINPSVERLYERIKMSKIFRIVSVSIFLISIVAVFYFSDKTGRDKNKIEDVYAVGEIIPQKSIIGITLDVREDWGLHGYMFRYFRISLDSKTASKHEYFLIKKSTKINSDKLLNYEQIPIKFNDLILFQKNTK